MTWYLQVPNVRLAVARVVSSVPEVYQHNSLHLVRAAADHLGLDKDRDVQAAICSKTQQEGEGEEREWDVAGLTIMMLNNTYSQSVPSA